MTTISKGVMKFTAMLAFYVVTDDSEEQPDMNKQD